jgi:hypothetical protein
MTQNETLSSFAFRSEAKDIGRKCPEPEKTARIYVFNQLQGSTDSVTLQK